MTSRRPSHKDIRRLTANIGPEDGLDPRYDRREPGGRGLGRKTLQLCGQVAETISQLLPGSPDDVLRDLEVAAVSPAGGGRLLVTLRLTSSAENHDFAVLQDRIAAAHGWLRNEVAAAVHRRKAPDLVFQVIA